jgi:serine/threonine-protein kinase RsbW
MLTETFPGRYNSLEKISQFVTSAARNAGLNESGVFAVQMAVDEACSNIIEHAYGGEDVGDIICTCDVTPDSLTVTLHDHGRPFNPNEIPEPDLSAPLEERREGGLGLYFMRKLMDVVHFSFSPQIGNTLIMVKRKDTET